MARSGDGKHALVLVRALVASLSSSARAIESSTGLTNAQLFLLKQAASHRVVSINELAALARTRQNGVSAVVGKLVRAGLLQKKPSPADRRRASVTVTRKGLRTLTEAPTSSTETLMRALDALTLRETRALVTGLEALTVALGAASGTAPLLFEDAVPPRRRGSRNGKH